MKIHTRNCVLLAMASLSFAASGKSSMEEALSVSPDGIIEGQINRVPARLQVRGDGIAYPVLNPATVEKFRIRSNFFADALGIQATVGPTVIPGHTAKVKFAFECQEISRRALWFDKPVVSDLDGSVGPGALPHKRVTLGTGIVINQPGVALLPLQVEDNRMGTSVRLGETRIFVMFNPLLPHSIASAGAGQVIALTHSGKWSGGQESTSINFGVERPVRQLSLSEPIEVGGLKLSRFLVRDNGRVIGVEDNENSMKGDDPNEVTLPAVTVTANTGKTKPVYTLTVGQDAMGRCVSITFDKGSNQIELRCEEGTRVGEPKSDHTDSGV